MERDQVFTVALVVVDGKNTAAKINLRILKKLHPSLASDHETLNSSKLHMVEMSEDYIMNVASMLALEPINVYASYRYHDSTTAKFAGFFEQYRSMVKQVIFMALDYSNEEISISVGAMGLNRLTDRSLCGEFESVPKLFAGRNRGAYRKLSCDMASSSNRGIQIADFYAGSVRKMLLKESHGRQKFCDPYEVLAHQIRVEPAE